MSRDSQRKKRVELKMAQAVAAQNALVDLMTETHPRDPVLKQSHMDWLFVAEARADIIRQDLVEEHTLLEARILADVQSPPPPPAGAMAVAMSRRGHVQDPIYGGAFGAVMTSRGNIRNENRKGTRK